MELLAGKPGNAEQLRVVGNENGPNAERGGRYNGVRQFDLVFPPEAYSQVFHFFSEVNYRNFGEEVLYLGFRS